MASHLQQQTHWNARLCLGATRSNCNPMVEIPRSRGMWSQHYCSWVRWASEERGWIRRGLLRHLVLSCDHSVDYVLRRTKCSSRFEIDSSLVQIRFASLGYPLSVERRMGQWPSYWTTQSSFTCLMSSSKKGITTRPSCKEGASQSPCPAERAQIPALAPLLYDVVRF